MAKEHGTEKEVHGYQLGTAGEIILRGNLFLGGNPFGDISKEEEGMVSMIRWSSNQQKKT